MRPQVLQGLEEPAARQEQRVRERPQDGDAWGQLGSTYMRMGQDELALAVLQHAAGLGTTEVFAWYDLSFLLCEAGQPAEALEAARRAATPAPGDAGARELGPAKI